MYEAEREQERLQEQKELENNRAIGKALEGRRAFPVSLVIEQQRRKHAEAYRNRRVE